MDETRLNLTRRFGTADEARAEAESNLAAGSLWVPLIGEPPPLLRAVAITLVLPDGSALDGLRGRVTCVAPAGVAVVLDDLPSASILTRLLGGDAPPRPSLEPQPLLPEDAPPLPPGLAAVPDPWHPPPVVQPVAPPDTAPAATPPPVETAPAGDIEPRATAPADPVPDAGFARTPDPAPFVREPLRPEEGGVERAPVEATARLAPVQAPVATPPLIPTTPPPPAVAPPPSLAGLFDEARPRSETLDAVGDSALPALREGIDFPATRDQPVPAVVANPGLWAEDDGDLVPALKTGSAPVETDAPSEEPDEPPRPVFTLRFADAEALATAWKGALGAGRALVPVTGEPPPIDAPVEVTLILPDVGALVLEGTVVHRAAGEAGVRLTIDGTSRALIESALPGSPEPVPPVAPETPSPEPAPAPAPESRRPSLELRTSPLTGQTEVIVSFESLADFRREYETNIRRGGVMVPTTERPAVRSRIEVVFSLLGGKREVRLSGEVVLHGPSGIGIQLAEIPATTRVEIDSLLAAAGPGASATPPPPQAAPPVRAAPSPSPSLTEPRPAAVAAMPRATFTPSGTRVEGELVEVMREAEVEGEAGGSTAKIGSKASWLKVLAHLQATRSTGVLQAERKAEKKSFVIFQGRVLDARGEPPRDDESMLRVIRKHNLAKPGVLRMLEKALDKVPDELTALQGSGAWTAADIDRARRWQVLERCSEVFGWEKGRFKFDPEGDRSWMRPTPGVPFGHVILHGVHAYIRASGDDMARILRPGMERFVKVVPNTGFEPTRVGLSDKELQLWADIDGKKTLRQLLASAATGVSQAHRLIFALCRLGVLSLERAGGGNVTAKPGSERMESLRSRLTELESRDVFGRLSLSWMCSAVHVQTAWDAIRRELDADVKAGGPAGDMARRILALCEEAYRQLMNDRTRRLQRLKVIEDPSRIEAAADMLAERAELLRLQGDKPGAESALQMAIDMAPENPAFLQALARVRAG